MEDQKGFKNSKSASSQLSGCYLLIVIGEPSSIEHRDVILQKITKGFLSWDLEATGCCISAELQYLVDQAPIPEDAKNGERLIQFVSEQLVTEVLINPQATTLQQCIKNLLSSYTKHKHVIHSGYTFAGSGSWILQDSTFSFADFLDTFQDPEVQRIFKAYENCITVHVHCAPEGDWNTSSVEKEPWSKLVHATINPNDKCTTLHGVTNFVDFVGRYVIAQPLEEILEPSDVVGNIRFSRPTLYVFPGGQGDSALFGVNGFNMLIDGGFNRRACFWDFARHLDRVDAMLVTRVSNSNMNGVSSFLKRKVMTSTAGQVYPKIGHMFCNIVDRKHSPDGDKDTDSLLISLAEEGDLMMENLRHIGLKPQNCYRDDNDDNAEPLNLYHKVGHGKLDMYVLNPAKDSREVKEFLRQWHSQSSALGSSKLGLKVDGDKEVVFPVPNLMSICAILVWQPADPTDSITRILFPGSSPQSKIFEGLEKIRPAGIFQSPVCSEKSLQSFKATIKTTEKTNKARLIGSSRIQTSAKMAASTDEHSMMITKPQTRPERKHEPIMKIVSKTEEKKVSAEPSKTAPKVEIKVAPKMEARSKPPPEVRKTLEKKPEARKVVQVIGGKVIESTAKVTNGVAKASAAPSKSMAAPKAKGLKEATNKKAVEDKKKEAISKSKDVVKKVTRHTSVGVATSSSVGKIAAAKPLPSSGKPLAYVDNNKSSTESDEKQLENATTNEKAMKIDDVIVEKHDVPAAQNENGLEDKELPTDHAANVDDEDIDKESSIVRMDELAQQEQEPTHGEVRPATSQSPPPPPLKQLETSDNEVPILLAREQAVEDIIEADDMELPEKTDHVSTVHADVGDDAEEGQNDEALKELEVDTHKTTTGTVSKSVEDEDETEAEVKEISLDVENIDTLVMIKHELQSDLTDQEFIPEETPMQKDILPKDEPRAHIPDEPHGHTQDVSLNLKEDLKVSIETAEETFDSAIFEKCTKSPTEAAPEKADKEKVDQEAEVYVFEKCVVRTQSIDDNKDNKKEDRIDDEKAHFDEKEARSDDKEADFYHKESRIDHKEADIDDSEARIHYKADYDDKKTYFDDTDHKEANIDHKKVEIDEKEVDTDHKEAHMGDIAKSVPADEPGQKTDWTTQSITDQTVQTTEKPLDRATEKPLDKATDDYESNINVQHSVENVAPIEKDLKSSVEDAVAPLKDVNEYIPVRSSQLETGEKVSETEKDINKVSETEKDIKKVSETEKDINKVSETEKDINTVSAAAGIILSPIHEDAPKLNKMGLATQPPTHPHQPEFLRTPDEVADLPIHEEVPSEFDGYYHIRGALHRIPETLAEHDSGPLSVLKGAERMDIAEAPHQEYSFQREASPNEMGIADDIHLSTLKADHAEVVTIVSNGTSASSSPVSPKSPKEEQVHEAQTTSSVQPEKKTIQAIDEPADKLQSAQLEDHYDLEDVYTKEVSEKRKPEDNWLAMNELDAEELKAEKCAEEKHKKEDENLQLKLEDHASFNEGQFKPSSDFHAEKHELEEGFGERPIQREDFTDADKLNGIVLDNQDAKDAPDPAKAKMGLAVDKQLNDRDVDNVRLEEITVSVTKETTTNEDPKETAIQRSQTPDGREINSEQSRQLHIEPLNLTSGAERPDEEMLETSTTFKEDSNNTSMTVQVAEKVSLKHDMNVIIDSSKDEIQAGMVEMKPSEKPETNGLHDFPKENDKQNLDIYVDGKEISQDKDTMATAYHTDVKKSIDEQIESKIDSEHILTVGMPLNVNLQQTMQDNEVKNISIDVDTMVTSETVNFEKTSKDIAIVEITSKITDNKEIPKDVDVKETSKDIKLKETSTKIDLNETSTVTEPKEIAKAVDTQIASKAIAIEETAADSNMKELVKEITTTNFEDANGKATAENFEVKQTSGDIHYNETSKDINFKESSIGIDAQESSKDNSGKVDFKEFDESKSPLHTDDIEFQLTSSKIDVRETSDDLATTGPADVTDAMATSMFIGSKETSAEIHAQETLKDNTQTGISYKFDGHDIPIVSITQEHVDPKPSTFDEFLVDKQQAKYIPSYANNVQPTGDNEDDNLDIHADGGDDRSSSSSTIDEHNASAIIDEIMRSQVVDPMTQSFYDESTAAHDHQPPVSPCEAVYEERFVEDTKQYGGVQHDLTKSQDDLPSIEPITMHFATPDVLMETKTTNLQKDEFQTAAATSTASKVDMKQSDIAETSFTAPPFFESTVMSDTNATSKDTDSKDTFKEISKHEEMAESQITTSWIASMSTTDNINDNGFTETLKHMDTKEIVESAATARMETAKDGGFMRTSKDVEFAKDRDSKETFEDIDSKETFKQMDSKEAIKQIDSKETFENIDSKETFKQIDSKETIKQIDSKEMVKQIDSKETFKQIDSKETFENIDSKETFKQIDSKEMSEQIDSKETFKQIDSKEMLKDTFKQIGKHEEIAESQITTCKIASMPTTDNIKDSGFIETLKHMDTKEILESAATARMETAKDGGFMQTSKDVDFAKDRDSKETFEDIDSKETFKQIDSKETIKQIDSKETIKQIDSKETFENIDSKETFKQIDSKETIKQIDSKETIKQIDSKEILKDAGIKEISDQSSTASVIPSTKEVITELAEKPIYQPGDKEYEGYYEVHHQEIVGLDLLPDMERSQSAASDRSLEQMKVDDNNQAQEHRATSQMSQKELIHPAEKDGEEQPSVAIRAQQVSLSSHPFYDQDCLDHLKNDNTRITSSFYDPTTAMINPEAMDVDDMDNSNCRRDRSDTFMDEALDAQGNYAIKGGFEIGNTTATKDPTAPLPKGQYDVTTEGGHYPPSYYHYQMEQYVDDSRAGGKMLPDVTQSPMHSGSYVSADEDTEDDYQHGRISGQSDADNESPYHRPVQANTLHDRMMTTGFKESPPPPNTTGADTTSDESDTDNATSGHRMPPHYGQRSERYYDIGEQQKRRGGGGNVMEERPSYRSFSAGHGGGGGNGGAVGAANAGQGSNWEDGSPVQQLQSPDEAPENERFAHGDLGKHLVAEAAEPPWETLRNYPRPCYPSEEEPIPSYGFPGYRQANETSTDESDEASDSSPAMSPKGFEMDSPEVRHLPLKFQRGRYDSDKHDQELGADQSNVGYGEPSSLNSPNSPYDGKSPMEEQKNPPTSKNPFHDWGEPMGLPSPIPPVGAGHRTLTKNNVASKMNGKGPEQSPASPKRFVGPKGSPVKTATNKRPESPAELRKFKGHQQLQQQSASPIYVDLTYVPHHGNPLYSDVEFFRTVRARYYVFSGTNPSKEVFDALLTAKQSWDDPDLEVTIIPTYDTDTLGYWFALHEDELAKHKIDLAPSASRCTINLQDHETSCSAYRLEF